MKKLITLVILLIALSIGHPSYLNAEETKACEAYKILVGKLKNGYNEYRAAIGLTNDGNIFEVFSTKNGKTWSVLVTKPNGEACLLLAGESLELIESLEGIKITYPLVK